MWVYFSNSARRVIAGEIAGEQRGACRFCRKHAAPRPCEPSARVAPACAREERHRVIGRSSARGSGVVWTRPILRHRCSVRPRKEFQITGGRCLQDPTEVLTSRGRIVMRSCCLRRRQTFSVLLLLAVTPPQTLASDAPTPTPAIVTWQPALLAADDPLGPAQLNATASVPGTFTYTPAAGTVIAVGAYSGVVAMFTPDDTTCTRRSGPRDASTSSPGALAVRRFGVLALEAIKNLVGWIHRSDRFDGHSQNRGPTLAGDAYARGPHRSHELPAAIDRDDSGASGIRRHADPAALSRVLLPGAGAAQPLVAGALSMRSS